MWKLKPRSQRISRIATIVQSIRDLLDSIDEALGRYAREAPFWVGCGLNHGTEGRAKNLQAGRGPNCDSAALFLDRLEEAWKTQKCRSGRLKKDYAKCTDCAGLQWQTKKKTIRRRRI